MSWLRAGVVLGGMVVVSASCGGNQSTPNQAGDEGVEPVRLPDETERAHASDNADCNFDGAEDDRPYCCAKDDAGTLPHIQEPYCRLYCDYDEVYCVSATGDPLGDEGTPTLSPGRQVIVRVVAHANEWAGHMFTLRGSDSDFEAQRRIPKNDAVGGGAGAPATTPDDSGEPASCTGSCDEYRLASYTLVSPDTRSRETVRLTVTSDSGATVAQRTYAFTVNRGKFYYELGLMFPITFGGSRSISTAPVAGTNLERLEVTEDASWALGFGTIIYPWGVYDYRSEDPRAYKHFRYLGIGLGTNLHSPRSPFTEAYLTLNYRFSYGAVLGLGVSATKGEFLSSRYSRGDLLPANTTAEDVTRERYMFRPNLTLTISADVLRGLVDLMSDVRSSEEGPNGPRR